MSRCTVCGDLLGRADAEFGDACCPECSSEAPPYERAVSFGSYTGALRQLVHLLKYERVRAAAPLLGRFTAQACMQLEGDIDVSELLMIPVPAHKIRMRSRGFNQAELIARAAQRGIEGAIGRKLTLELTALLRVRFVESQVALTSEERRQQIRGAFKVTAREQVKGREILLVDDVLTTGATAAECARELRQAGAAKVWVVTPARALSRVAMESFEVLGRNESDRFSSQTLLSDSLPSSTAQGSLLQHRGISQNYGEQRVGERETRARLL